MGGIAELDSGIGYSYANLLQPPGQRADVANWGITTIGPPDNTAADEGLTRFLLDIRQLLDREE
ncbi:hypothetical protein GGD66_007947 [Bradyrhizobium sp. CIR48]|nr:hypothetical protein [Bradyrhizobium sp. CIR18]MBB4429345.1 hypothetical protein [Bradyrhizobium sp. CIR48]